MSTPTTTNIETHPEIAQLMDFTEPVPEQAPVGDDDMRYAWSPGQDIDCSDRAVGHTRIERCKLYPFRTIRTLGPDPGRPMTMANMYEGGMGEQVHLVWRPKSARACAEELRYAYAETNPVGFTVFDAPWAAKVKRAKSLPEEEVRGFGLVGMDRDAAFEIYRTILPYVLTPPDILLYLQTESEEAIAGADFPPDIEAMAKSIRRQMLDSTAQVAREYAMGIDMSERELGERPGTGKGKPVFDDYDRHRAAMMGRALGAQRAVVAPAPQITSDPAIARVLEMLVAERGAGQPIAETETERLLREQNDLLKAQLAELQSKGKGKDKLSA